MSNKNFKNQSYRNYGQYSKQNEENEKTAAPVSTNVEEAAGNVDDKPKTSFSIVNCSRLNIRKRPDIDSDPLCVVEKDCKLKVDSNYQNDDWIKVTTPDGVSGYCMLKFVDLK